MAMTPPGAGTFTAFHLVILALLIAAALAMIAAGVRRSRARRASDDRVDSEASDAGLPGPPAPAAPPSLDRSAADAAPGPRTEDDFVRPRPVVSGPPAFEPGPAPLAPVPLHDERIAAAAPMEASPATMADPTSAGTPDPTPVDAPPSPADGSPTQLKGLGPKVAARLAELGLETVGQIAALDADQVAAVDARLGPFAGRLHRDRWVEQARFLAAGDTKGFEAVFGRL